VSNPQLLVIAGCNGSGKSTYSKSLSPDDVIPFDYDRHFLNIYNSKPDSELRERMSHNQAFEILEQSIEKAIRNRTDFCYETNFNSTPMHWPEKFKNFGYEINMIYFCLDSVAEAKRRVQIRYENGGHYVPDYEVEERFYLT
jgi:predicted ABC-type ATPase